MNPYLLYLAKVAKAIAAALVCAAAYLVGVLSEDETLGDLTTVQWLGLVVFLGGAYGITWAVPNRRTSTTTVRLSSDQLGALERGQQIQRELDEYRRNGGKGGTL